MLMISWVWALVAFAVMLGIYWLISQRRIQANWGDLKSGLAFERARRNLRILEERLYHPKNWRPILLTLSGAGGSRRHLAIYGHWLTAGHGIQTLGQVIQGDVFEMVKRRASQLEVLRKFIRGEAISAFPAVTVAPSVERGIVNLVQNQGLGGLEPNTVLIGWPSNPERFEVFAQVLGTIAKLGKSLAVLRCEETPERPWQVPPGTIDVWWRGRQNGPLLLLLAHLLSQNPGWRQRRIRLIRVIPSEAARAEVLEHLSGLAQSSRIDAKPLAVVGDDPVATIREHSAHSAITILGFSPPSEEEAAGFVEHQLSLMKGIPRVLAVFHAGGIELES